MVVLLGSRADGVPGARPPGVPVPATGRRSITREPERPGIATKHLTKRLVRVQNLGLGRLDFSPTEAVALGLDLEAIEKPKAKERERVRKGKQPGAKSGKLPHLGDTRDAVALGLDLEAIEKPKAKERHKQGSSRGGKGGGKLPQPSEKTRDAVGAGVGMSGKTYERAKAVTEAVEAEPVTAGVPAA